MRGAYYNEFDPYAAQWLRNLIAAGHIAPGEVDERSIVDVQPDDLRGYTQCHFFAGIGGWSLAARLAGWPDDRPLWTGSCPCQPFSAAGKRKGTADERHLWPEFYRLIAACRPAVVAGEQVASKDGRLWLAGVRADLEAVAYDLWASDICAAGVGAPHIRQRLWWLADTHSGSRRQGREIDGGRYTRGDALEGAGSGGSCMPGWMADAYCGERDRQPDGEGCEFDGTATRRIEGDGQLERSGPTGRLGDTHKARRLGGTEPDERTATEQQTSRWADAERSGFWSAFDILHCTDGKARRIEPGSFPLAHGVSNRVGRLRAYGNAIVPWLAAEVLGAYLDGES